MTQALRILTKTELAHEADVGTGEVDELVAALGERGQQLPSIYAAFGIAGVRAVVAAIVDAGLPVADARELLPPADWDDAGEATLKGIADPVGLARIR